MRTYVKPQIKMIEADLVLLSMSEIGPGATDIFAPDVINAKGYSIWDEEIHFYNNINKEENYEVYE